MLSRALPVPRCASPLAKEGLRENQVGKGVRKVAVSVAGNAGHKGEDPLGTTKLPNPLVGHLQVILHPYSAYFE